MVGAVSDALGRKGVGHFGTSDRATATITSGGSANTKAASYTELLAATTYDSYGLYVALTVNNASRDYLCDIGIGAAAAETALIPDLAYSGNVDTEVRGYACPIFVPGGTRISARCQATIGSSGLVVHVVPLPLNRPDRGGLPVFCEAYGAAAGDSGGVSVDPGATINTKGSYSTLGTTTRRLSYISFGIGGQTNTVRSAATWFMDIALALGSDVVVYPDIPVYAFTTHDTVRPHAIGPFPCDIPSGTVIKARSQCTINDAADRLFDVVAYGFSHEK